MHGVDKNHPSAAWIEHLRQKFPCETTVDKVLTRKLQRRAGPPYRQMSLETLVTGVQQMWIGFLALAPLIPLLITGAYLLILPYLPKSKSA